MNRMLSNVTILERDGGEAGRREGERGGGVKEQIDRNDELRERRLNVWGRDRQKRSRNKKS